jgi:hypothetical protein
MIKWQQIIIGCWKKNVENIGCVNLNMILFSFCTIRLIIKELRIGTLHHKFLISHYIKIMCIFSLWCFDVKYIQYTFYLNLCNYHDVILHYFYFFCILDMNIRAHVIYFLNASIWIFKILSTYKYHSYLPCMKFMQILYKPMKLGNFVCKGIKKYMKDIMDIKAKIFYIYNFFKLRVICKHGKNNIRGCWKGLKIIVFDTMKGTQKKTHRCKNC